MTALALSLRPATPSDEARLLEWRNDPGTRATGFADDEVAPGEHHAWLTRRLADAGTRLLIVEEGPAPVGSLRLERRDGRAAELSITLAPEARGRGLGPGAIRLAVPRAGAELGAERVLARVLRANAASLRAFEAAGFRAVREHDGVVELEARP